MKQKKTFRLIIVIVFVLLAAVIAFVLMPSIYANEDAVTDIVMLRQNVTEGTKITEAMVATVSVGAYGLDPAVIKDPAQIVGKYATQSISSKDLLFKEKFTETPPNNDAAIADIIELADDQMLLTLQLSSTAAGAAGNIMPGDIVNVAVYRTIKQTSSNNGGFGAVVGGEEEPVNPDANDVVIFPEPLQEMTVYRVLNSSLSTIDPDATSLTGATNQRVPIYITLVCTQSQADLLLEYAYSATVHFIEVE